MELVEMAFSGVINVGSPEPCSKYTFGIYLSEMFGLERSLITIGSITEHEFNASRSSNLTLDNQRLFDLNIKVPDYKASINCFYENRPVL